MKINKKSLCLVILTSLFAATFSATSFARNIDLVDSKGKELSEEDFEDADFDMGYEPQINNSSSSKIWDPWEKMNRKIFKFNVFVLKNIVKPIYSNIYIKITTPEIRKSIANIVNNFRMPITFANYVLQLDFENSAKALYSFGVNSVFGVFGFADVAGSVGVSVPSTDLGITLEKYHIPAGPFLMLPFFGPNDIIGTLTWGVELAVDPLDYNVLKIGGKRPLFNYAFIYTRGALYTVDSATFAVENFYDLMLNSFDPYIMMRDAYAQSQNYKINKARGKI